MALNEIQRQTYLTTMGIQSYFPRVKLPAAKDSVQCAWPEEILEQVDPLSLSTGLHVKKQDPPIQDVPIQETDQKPKQAETLASNILSEINLNKTAQKVVPEAPILKAPDTENKSAVTSNEVHFQLVFIRVNEQLSIINQIPYIGNQCLSVNHRNLLSNILRALQLEVDQVEYDDFSFRWPLGEEKHLDKSEAAAKQMLNSYLEQKQASAGFKCLLVMGEMLSAYINQEDKAWQVITTHSLDEMLTMPLVKRDVWQLLRHIDFTSLS